MKTQSPLGGNVYRVFAKYCMSSVFGMLGISIYILADTFFIANGVGVLGLSALNIVIPAYSIMQAVGLLIGVGGAAYAAIERGKGNREQCSRIYSFALFLGIAFGIVCVALGITAPEQITRLLGASEQTIVYGTEYLRVVLCFGPMFILNNIALAFVRNDQAPHLAMAAMLAGSLFNVVGDYIAIYVLNLGMFGAALATGLSPVIGLVILLKHLCSKKCFYKFRPTRLDWSFLKPIFSGGGASFVTEFAVGIVVLLFNGVILSLKGDVGVAAYGIIANITIVANSVFTGIGMAVQPIVSINYGAGERARMQKTLKAGMVTALMVGVVLYSAGVLFADGIISVFNGENNAVLAEIAKGGIWRYMMAYLPMGMNIIAAAYFQSILNMRMSLILSLMRGIVCVVPMLYLFAALFGMEGVWMVPVAAELATLGVALIALRKGKEAV